MSTVDRIFDRLESIESMLSMNSSPVDVFINISEVQRLLGITNPTVHRLTKDGLLDTHENRVCSQNRYKLAEVLWLKRQNYKQLGALGVAQLVSRKQKEFI